MMVACLGHAGVLVASSTLTQENVLSISHVAAALALFVTITMLVMNRYIKNYVFLPAVCGFSALLITINLISPSSEKIGIDMSTTLIIHITLSLIAYAVLSLSFIYAIQLSYISHQLKNKKLHLANSDLPPFQSVETILDKLMIIGCGLLFIALASGFIFLPDMFSDGYAHKTLLSLVAFIIYFIGIVAHKVIGLRSRLLVLVNFVGLGTLTLGYFGSRIVAELIL